MDLETQENQENSEVSMEDTIRETLDKITTSNDDVIDDGNGEQEKPEKASQKRDESGKFAKADPVEGKQEQEQQPAAEKTTKKAPSSWRKEAQEKFLTLDPVAQNEILKREEDFHRGVESYKQKASIFDQLDKVISPFAENYRSEGKNAIQAVQELFALDHGLRHGTPQQKAAVVHEIMRIAGMTPETLAQAPKIDPNLSALEQRLNQLQAALRQRDEHTLRQQEQSLHSEISRWSQGKEHFETVRETMAALLHAEQAENLDEAYEMATWGNPTIRAQIIAKQQEAARAESTKKAQEAKRSAAVNVQRRGAIEPTSKPTGSMDDTLRETAKRLGIIQ